VRNALLYILKTQFGPMAQYGFELIPESSDSANGPSDRPTRGRRQSGEPDAPAHHSTRRPADAIGRVTSFARKPSGRAMIVGLITLSIFFLQRHAGGPFLIPLGASILAPIVAATIGDSGKGIDIRNKYFRLRIGYGAEIGFGKDAFLLTVLPRSRVGVANLSLYDPYGARHDIELELDQRWDSANHNYLSVLGNYGRRYSFSITYTRVGKCGHRHYNVVIETSPAVTITVLTEDEVSGKFAKALARWMTGGNYKLPLLTLILCGLFFGVENPGRTLTGSTLLHGSIGINALTLFAGSAIVTAMVNFARRTREKDRLAQRAAETLHAVTIAA
jgi:hypothetical protein